MTTIERAVRKASRVMTASEQARADAMADAETLRLVTWDVCEGRPSWHQQRAGAICAAVTSGFKTREDAEAYIARLHTHHPEIPAFVIRRER